MKNAAAHCVYLDPANELLAHPAEVSDRREAMRRSQRIDPSDLRSISEYGRAGQVRLIGLVDEVMSRLDGPPENQLFVLHEQGSHGPAYGKRYPPEFEEFRPACHSEDLHSCSAAEVENAYDNTILYTDHVLNQMI